jgi:hypothetical protein
MKAIVRARLFRNNYGVEDRVDAARTGPVRGRGSITSEGVLHLAPSHHGGEIAQGLGVGAETTRTQHQ